MNNSALMSAAIHDGLTDDATASAALDAIREESGCSLLSAILEVARVWHAGQDAREIAEATRLLEPRRRLRPAILSLLRAECSDLPDSGTLDVVVVAGSSWPNGRDVSLAIDGGWMLAGTVTVGARWLIQRAEVIRRNLDETRRAKWRAKKK